MKNEKEAETYQHIKIIRSLNKERCQDKDNLNEITSKLEEHDALKDTSKGSENEKIQIHKEIEK